MGPVSEVPVDLARPFGTLIPGYHEAETHDAELHALVRPHPDRDGLVLSIARFPESERAEDQLALAILAGLVTTVLAGGLLGWLLARRLVAPIERLEKRLAAGQSPYAWGLPADEIGALARALDEAHERTQRARRRERLFLREASHELRTPVTVIQGVCDLLADEDPADDPRFTDRLGRIARSVRRMNATIQSLLWMAREESRRSAQDGLPIATQLTDLIEEFRLLLPPGVELVATPPHHDRPFRDSTLLMVALSNLIRNAIEHTESGEIQVAIEGRWARVADSGRGIDSELLQRLNDPDAPAGGGLGLPIVHRICRRCGWRFELSSEVGRGTAGRIQFAPATEQD
ncbi:MAG: HAMP domain-containing sensor histidine kinase [Acidobacteriota bacterium]